ncbi:MAG: DUF4290 domain-containing protein [Bacteroidetes bacterium]|nr:DUF4290 domain-containing protein [Bacteroidota bacterium]MBS1685923.1 DUF4290 domain-containing protein [Bacteroidota bacterium]
MEYNTVREKITLAEYGRHIKRIVDNCIKIEDREHRNRTAHEIIELMGQLNPHLRNVEDFRHKLWDHLFMISEFKLDVDSPYPKTTKSQIIEKPEPLEYPQTKIKHRHYGKNVAALVSKAVEVEDPEKRLAFAQCIGNYMKLTYVNWNKENTNDEIIKNDLNIISKGELSLSVEDNISELSRANRQSNINQNNNNGKRQFNNQGRNNNNQNRNNQNRNNNNQNRNNNNNNNGFRKQYNNNKNRNNDIQKGQ